MGPAKQRRPKRLAASACIGGRMFIGKITAEAKGQTGGIFDNEKVLDNFS
jgi:hypothetical protein